MQSPCYLQELRLKVLALRAFNLESMLIGEHVKSKEPIVTQIRCVGVGELEQSRAALR